MTVQLSAAEAYQQFTDLLDRAVTEKEPVVITREGKPNAILMAEDEYRSMAETLYLLSTPANARRLFEAIEQARRGEGIVMTVEELRDRFGLHDEAE